MISNMQDAERAGDIDNGVCRVPDEDLSGIAWTEGIAREWAPELADSREDIYAESQPAPPKQESLHDFLRRSPLVGVELDLTRNKDLGRDIDL